MDERADGAADPRAARRTRTVLLAFGVAAVVSIAGALALPGLMVERAVTACEAEGGTYDRASATCLP